MFILLAIKILKSVRFSVHFTVPVEGNLSCDIPDIRQHGRDVPRTKLNIPRVIPLNLSLRWPCHCYFIEY